MQIIIWKDLTLQIYCLLYFQRFLKIQLCLKKSRMQFYFVSHCLENVNKQSTIYFNRLDAVFESWGIYINF